MEVQNITIGDEFSEDIVQFVNHIREEITQFEVSGALDIATVHRDISEKTVIVSGGGESVEGVRCTFMFDDSSPEVIDFSEVIDTFWVEGCEVQVINSVPDTIIVEVYP